MPSYKPRITVYTDAETDAKLALIAKLENRSSSNYTEYLIQKAIHDFEKEHGAIKIKIEERKEDNTAVKVIKAFLGITTGEMLADIFIEKVLKK